MKFHAALFLSLLGFAVGAEPSTSLATHDFFFAGESKTHDLYIIKKGEVAWAYNNASSRGEVSDAVLLSNGSVLFAHQHGVTLLDAAKKVLWKYETPDGCETHTARPIGKEHVVFIQNGPEPKCFVVNVTSGKTVREFPLPVGNPKGVHGQFRHAELTAAGTLLVAHMDNGKVAEYDDHGKELWSAKFPGPWSASRLDSGNTLVTNPKLIREITPAGETVWEFTPADLPEGTYKSFQIATRLPNGNTLLNNWINSWNEKVDPATAPPQAFEVTPDKKIVWTLQSWKDPVNLGPATIIQLLDKPSAPENAHFGEFR